MTGLILPPNWFFAPDVLIDLFSFIILFAFAIISIKYYKLSKNKSFLYLGLAFLAITLGEFFEVLMNLKLYYNLTQVLNLGNILLTMQTVKPLLIINYIASFFNKLFIMIGFYFLYYTTRKTKSRLDALIIVYFIIITAILTQSAHFFFCITVAMFLFFIFLNYLNVYNKTKTENSKILAIAFLILLISYLITSIYLMNPLIYIIANSLQLVAFIILLYLIIRIYKNGEPKPISRPRQKK